MGVTPASGSTITYSDIFISANPDLNPATVTNISASILMKEPWPKGPYGNSTYPYTGWGSSGSYNYANRLCGTRQQNTTQSLGKFYDLRGTCVDDNSWPSYGVEYSVDVLFGDSNDNITDVEFKITDSLTTTTLVSDSQAILEGPFSATDTIQLSTEYTPNVQNCYWTLDFTCEYKNSGQGSMRGFCDTNDGNGLVQVFVVNPIYDATTYNLSYNTNGYAPTASLTGSTGGGFKWKFEFN